MRSPPVSPQYREAYPAPTSACPCPCWSSLPAPNHFIHWMAFVYWPDCPQFIFQKLLGYLDFDLIVLHVGGKGLCQLYLLLRCVLGHLLPGLPRNKEFWTTESSSSCHTLLYVHLIRFLCIVMYKSTICQVSRFWARQVKPNCQKQQCVKFRRRTNVQGATELFYPLAASLATKIETSEFSFLIFLQHYPHIISFIILYILTILSPNIGTKDNEHEVFCDVVLDLGLRESLGSI